MRLLSWGRGTELPRKFLISEKKKKNGGREVKWIIL